MNSEWFGNLAGIVPNTLDSELYPPQRDAVIAGNDVHDNGNPGAPTLALTYPAFGTGILVTGGRDNLVSQNLVEDSGTYGILVVPIFDEHVWVTADNAVRDNIVRRSGMADLGLGAPSEGGDCFADNDATTSQPPAIELLYPCCGRAAVPGRRRVDGADDHVPRALPGGARRRRCPAGTGARSPPRRDNHRWKATPPQAPPIIAIGGENVPQPFRIRDATSIRPASGPDRIQGDRHHGCTARNVVGRPADRPLRLRPAVRAVRDVGRGRACGT